MTLCLSDFVMYNSKDNKWLGVCQLVMIERPMLIWRAMIRDNNNNIRRQ